MHLVLRCNDEAGAAVSYWLGHAMQLESHQDALSSATRLSVATLPMSVSVIIDRWCPIDADIILPVANYQSTWYHVMQHELNRLCNYWLTIETSNCTRHAWIEWFCGLVSMRSLKNIDVFWLISEFLLLTLVTWYAVKQRRWRCINK